MQADEYNRRGKELVNYITEYLTNIRERRVVPDVQPGYMRKLLPDHAPLEPENWDNIFNDIEKIIMPGVVHWQSPHMHAYFPALNSWPSLLGEMLADAINCLGFTWASSPACTELEMNVLDWLAKAMGLPPHFLHHHPDSRGGGILQGTVSESTLLTLLAARKAKILQLHESGDDTDDSILNSRLIAYASDQAHSSVEKAGLITMVKIRFLPTDDQFSLRGETLQSAIEEDRKKGLIPVMLCATLGTTGVCAFDCLSELGPLCEKEGLWLHIDAAYAGSAFLCPEQRGFLNGVEFADSFVFNPSKWMMVHFDCTALWVRDKYKLQQTFSVDPLYLRHENSNVATDFMNWQIPLSKRFRSLKLWFVLRSFGLKKLQEHIRHGIQMAKLFESLVRSDPNFEIPAKRHLGLVVFCLKEGNAQTEALLKALTKSGALYVIPASVQNTLIIRFTVTSQFTTREDILRDWAIIRHTTAAVLSQEPVGDGPAGLQTPAPAGLQTPAPAADQGPPAPAPPETQRVPDEVLDRSPCTRGPEGCGCSQGCAGGAPADQQHAGEPLADQQHASVLKLLSKEGLLSRLPEGVVLLEKKALRKLTKFYSMPTFMPCGPLQQCTGPCGVQLFQQPWLTCSRASAALPCLNLQR
ncbi:histidine decarboxylase [Conger conger]|uniref:histidine decarboxylase n=1 Tax=Conger conger TaxID=82655 RepID=UPI002A5AF84F|nr:histidine decarboxylase [Conger conger]